MDCWQMLSAGRLLDKYNLLTNKKNTIMKNLENSALMQEMNVNEMQEVNGGWVALALAVAGAAIYVYNNWDDFCVGVNEGWNGTRN